MPSAQRRWEYSARAAAQPWQAVRRHLDLAIRLFSERAARGEADPATAYYIGIAYSLLDDLTNVRVLPRLFEQAPDPVRMRVVDPNSLTGLDPATKHALTKLAEANNANASILNSLLFTYMDYAAIGYKG